MKRKEDLVKLGSETAKGGFRTEDEIVNKFNNWKNDSDAQKWLEIMGYNLDEIEKVIAVKITGNYKTDVQAQVTIFMKKAISAENISVKLISNIRGYNQVDKRWVDKYAKLWNIPGEITAILKKFTGEIPPEYKNGLRDKRRMFFDEISTKSQKLVLDFFTVNKILVISDILKGRGKFSANWMLVIFKSKKEKKWVLKSINYAMNIFGQGEVKFSPRGSLRIGKITMQRKGGNAGRITSQMLQFKINPAELFYS